MAGLAKLFGSRLRALRDERGFSQAELADRAGLSEEWIRRMERGEGGPSLQTIETIAGALSADPAELFARGAPATPVERLARAVQGLDKDQLDWLIKGARLFRAKERPARPGGGSR